MKEFKRVYYKLEITSLSPLSIGSGLNANTDKDVIVDSLGRPFIPATSIAGVLRSTISDLKVADSIFGYIPTEKNDKRPEMKSLIRFYDANYYGEEGNYFITNRDCVKLENKVGEKGAKFDMEAVETGAKFVGYIEIFDSVDGINAEEIIENTIVMLNNGTLGFGTKTTRGYGKVSVLLYKKSFTKVDDWLNFDMFDSDWGKELAISDNNNGYFKLNISLKSKGGLSIREYTTEVSTDDNTAPDYRHISLHNKEKTPVIPGTSWSGAFLDRYAELSNKGKKDESIESLFGYVHKKNVDHDDKVQKSRVIFGESQLSGGVWKKITRNSIDRFTGGTKSGALYTELTYYYGETSLEILIKNPSDKEKKLLCACLADLHYGYLSVGGLTSVGRGLFEITAVNGKKTEGDIYEFLIEEVCGK